MKTIRIILVIVNVLVALGLVLTTLAGSVAPSKSMLLSLLSFGYIPMLAANMLAVLLWLVFRRWECIISIAAIAARWAFVGLIVQVGGTSKMPDREAHPQMLSLMTYNVHQFQGLGNDPKQSDSNSMAFLGIVDEHQPDVLCLQEFAAPKTVRLTDSLVLRGYNHYYGAHTSKGGTPYGTVIFSRLPIAYVKNIDQEKLLADIIHDSGNIRICCIHMDSYRFDDNDRQQIEQMRHGEVDTSSRRTLAKVKETILSHEKEWTVSLRDIVDQSSIPMILAGDLNDIPTSWLYGQIASRMTDTYCEKGSGMVATYNGGFPQVRIDVVFHSQGLKTLSYRRIRSDISDHYPVITSFEPTPKQ